MTRNAFWYCFHHPYSLFYFVFWLLTVFTQPRRGRVKIRTSFSLHSGTRTACNSRSCAAFSEGSLGTTHSSTDEQGSGKSWVCSTDSLTSPGRAGGVKGMVPWCQRRVHTASPHSQRRCGKEGLGLPEAPSLQHSSWGSVYSPPASQDLQTNGTIYPSFHL